MGRPIESESLTERQIAALRIIGENHGISANQLGFRLRRKAHIRKTHLNGGNLILPATAILRSLGDLVDCYLSSRDQWATKIWILTAAGRGVVEGRSCPK